MISVKPLVDRLNTLITAGGLGSREIESLSAAIDTIEKKGVPKVATESLLPAPILNKGRFFYIEDSGKYVLSNGTSWATKHMVKKTALYAWGDGTSGQLGDGTAVSKLSPVSVIGGFTDWLQVSDIGSHSLGLRANGTAWAWGFNGTGQLGDGTAVSTSSPVSVVGGYTDWIQVDAGVSHSLGLRANGTAWAWGNGANGRLGDGTVVTKSSPVSVVGGFTNWIQISGGTDHSLGVRANGTAWAWGSNSSGGRLGDGTEDSRSSPVSVIGGFTDWVQVSAGSTYSLGLRANGTAWAWGNGGGGQLGDGTTLANSSPVSVIGGFTDWIQIDTGAGHSLGVRANGTAWAWGSGLNGRLGDGTAIGRLSPVSVVGGYTDWIQVSAGTNHSLGLRANGTAWAWGLGTSGRLGDNTAVTKSSPVSVIGGFTDWVQVSAGSTHSVGLR
jgi:alpha-tubulin suppressor-like RCC1 family protein